ncbi:MAG TPA: hypothetical protein VGZ02_00150 [Candidatus Baltobacteraceae bacterium]|jgi:hypothetical protein|nr:hypothetical protein [Candidatus Baltobacteraceae bacterium]
MKAWVGVAVGFAADDSGNGVAYARAEGQRTLRVPFTVKRYAALLGREVGYAALCEVARVLHRRGFERIEFAIDDASLLSDLAERREVPAPLTLAYVRLRCALNQLREYRIRPAPGESDLTARARSDVALHVAA